MNDNENRRNQTFLRVQGFGSAHGRDFAEASTGLQLFGTLNSIITEVEGHAAAEVSGTGTSRQGTATRNEARAALREDLENITRTARIMAQDIPGLDDKFRLPRGNNDSQLLSAGRAYAVDAVPLKAQFLANEMPADFLEDLAADIEAMEQSMAEQSVGEARRIASGAALDDAIDRGIQVVRKLDAIVKNKYANNPAVLAEWTSASHTERAPRRKKGTEEGAGTGGTGTGGGSGSGSGTGGGTGTGGGSGGSSPPST
jgi:hypothetical protein